MQVIQHNFSIIIFQPKCNKKFVECLKSFIWPNILVEILKLRLYTVSASKSGYIYVIYFDYFVPIADTALQASFPSVTTSLET